MAALSIRNIDEVVRDRLRVRAARNGRSMEAEIRAILSDAVEKPDEPVNPFVVLMEEFAAIGGVELDIPPRNTYARDVALPE